MASTDVSNIYLFFLGYSHFMGDDMKQSEILGTFDFLAFSIIQFRNI